MKKTICALFLLFFISSLCYGNERSYLVKKRETFADGKIKMFDQKWDSTILRTFDIKKNKIAEKPFVYMDGQFKGTSVSASREYTILKTYKNPHFTDKHKNETLIRAIGTFADAIEILVLGDTYMVSVRNIGDEIQLYEGELVKK